MSTTSAPWRWRHQPLDRPACHSWSGAIAIAEAWDIADAEGVVVALAVWQADRCAVCGGWNKLDGLVLDHCHQSGMSRGILCLSCNSMEAHGYHPTFSAPWLNAAFAAYRRHPPTQMLNLQAPYADGIGWKAAYRRYEMRQTQELVAEIRRQELTFVARRRSFDGRS